VNRIQKNAESPSLNKEGVAAVFNLIWKYISQILGAKSSNCLCKYIRDLNGQQIYTRPIRSRENQAKI